MILNKHNLPAPLVAALTQEYKKPERRRYSVTSLIDSPLPRVLRMRYEPQDTDVSENMWILIGKAIHYVIEQGSDHTEKKLEIDHNGAKIVGVIDYHEGGEVVDWKITSVWSAMFAKDKNYADQLNVYSWMLRKKGFPVTKLSNYLILRDWNKNEAKRNSDYPQIPFVELNHPVGTMEDIEAYVDRQIVSHKCAEDTPDHLLDTWICSPADRWARPDSYACMKPKAQRATRVFPTKEEAVAFAGDAYEVVKRQGEDTRCLNYCSMSHVCPYGKELQ